LKNSIAQLVARAIDDLPEFAELSADLGASVAVERTRESKYGDFSTNIAMQLARPLRRNPRELAQLIIDKLPQSDLVEKVDVAGPGFINFFVSSAAFHEELNAILLSGERYGRVASRSEPRYLLEFVSANPTGPLHVGHGRHACYGATLGNLLQAAGYQVDREYYVNDDGRQMDILGVSVWLRMLQADGLELSFPDAGYKGDYIREIAADSRPADLPGISLEQLQKDLPADAPEGDKEAYIDALIGRAFELIGADRFNAIRQQSLESIRDEIREDLMEFGVEFDCWFSERSLSDKGLIDEALAVLKERDRLYEKDGATWFRATDYGDEKDRVVIRDNGVKTYFASDIAYHYDKRKRGYDLLIDVLGADHHGYVTRVRAGMEAMGFAADSLEVPFVQFVSLYRGGEKQSMSTRSGEFVTLRQLREEVGRDAARFFYVMRSNDQHLDFDLELATTHSNDNPVYYIQYVHARIAGVFKQLEEKSLLWDANNGKENLHRLTEKHELSLLSMLSRYPETIELAANNRAPQHLVHYLRDLANEFHSYYNAHTFIVEDAGLRDARLALITGTRIVIANGLEIIGVSSPDSM
jgi:arginyl-tRNA synthetase